MKYKVILSLFVISNINSLYFELYSESNQCFYENTNGNVSIILQYTTI